MRTVRPALATGLLLLTVACGKRDDRPVRVVVIGERARIVDPSVRPVRPADAVLMTAAAQGLVRLDAAGQIVPGLAIRWNVSDDGLSYIFRLGDARWPDGSPVTARAVVRVLRAAATPGSRNPLASVLTGIDEILATNDVIEIRLAAPRPNLLHHLARPELGIVRNGAGTGPFRVTGAADGDLTLARTVPDGEVDREEKVVLTAARPALGLALFGAGATDLLLGGSLNDLPLARAADPPAAALRFDPAAGLFGLAVVDIRGPLAGADVRRALSMAIDRDALVAAAAVPGSRPVTSLAAGVLSNLLAPTVPGWAPFPLPIRQTEARRLVGDARITVRVALPAGPGSRLLFAHIRRDWRAISVEAVRVDMARSADLRLIDEVAPSRGASWYLERFACARSPACAPQADVALAAARAARDPRVRAAHLADADRRLSDAAVFMPIAAPVRWSLVSRRVTGFRLNPYAVHSLTDLADRRRR